MNTCENLDSFEVAEEASQVCVLSPHSTVFFPEAASFINKERETAAARLVSMDLWTWYPPAVAVFPKLALAPQGCAAAVSKRLAVQPASHPRAVQQF